MRGAMRTTANEDINAEENALTEEEEEEEEGSVFESFLNGIPTLEEDDEGEATTLDELERMGRHLSAADDAG